jgi:hypothetical protein
MATPPSDPTPSDGPEPTPRQAPGPYGSAPEPSSPSPSWPYGAPAPPPPYGGAHGTGPYPGGPGMPAQRAPSKAMAIWSLILGWVPCLIGWVVAVVLAILVLSRSKDGRPHGRGLAIGGLVGVGVWVVLIVAVLAIEPFGLHRDSHGHVTRAGDVAIKDLRAGDCGDEPDTGLTREVHIVPCDQPHVLEVAATFDLTGETYPGDKVVRRQSVRGCIQRLSKLTQLQGHAELHGGYIRPSGGTWDVLKRVVCLVESDVPTTGSVIARES